MEDAPPKPTVFKQIKAFKRRSVETVFQKIGVSDPTVDSEYEDSKRRFDRSVRELHELGAGMASFLDKSKDMYSSCAELADVTYEYYWGRLMLDWPGAPNNLKSHQATAKYKETWNHNNDAIRRSVSKLWFDRALAPVRAYISATASDIQREADIRLAYVKDYDSYRRRFASLKERQSKITDPGSQRAADLEKALYQIQSKLTIAEDNYKAQNEKVKEELINAKVTRDEMLETAVMAMVTCHVELFAQTAKSLNNLLEFVPKEKVGPIKQEIDDLIGVGGPEIKPAEPNKLEKIVKGLALPSPSDFLPPSAHSRTSSSASAADGVITVSPQLQSGVPVSNKANNTTPNNNSSSTGFANMAKNLFTRSPSKDRKSIDGRNPADAYQGISSPTEQIDPYTGSQTASGPSGAGAAKVWAKAVYDNEPEDESELGFVQGEMLEIVSQDDSGWWEARAHGKTGSIPANYVEVIPGYVPS